MRGEPDIHLRVCRRYQDGLALAPSYAVFPLPQVGFLTQLTGLYRLFVQHAPLHGLLLETPLIAAYYA